ncbi:hypothetical protein AAFF_G00112850 [Aldrovandia affinis]|uniref:Uncharacterized protein n=1 Tax=Aldrovandia affinis TaxID=143900 RepID=A0AAD7WAD6_9TELE|nr:hypothetical protein AAFF_G00112850 [Aldrovandia affinis]
MMQSNVADGLPFDPNANADIRWVLFVETTSRTATVPAISRFKTPWGDDSLQGSSSGQLRPQSCLSVTGAPSSSEPALPGKQPTGPKGPSERLTMVSKATAFTV